MNHNPIRKRLLLNAALFTVAAVLLLIILYGPKQPQQVKRLPQTLNADNITRIRVERPGQTTVTLQKTHDHWNLVEPVNAPASAFRVNSILNLTLMTSHADYALSEIDASELGLTSPTATLYLNEHVIHFGGRDPINERRYTEFDRRVYLLDDYTLPLLTQPPASFIDTRLLPEQLTVISYQLPDFTVSQTDKGGWQIRPPKPEPGADALQDWVNRWRRQRATEVLYRSKFSTENGIVVVLQLAGDDSVSLSVIKNSAFSGIINIKQKLAYRISEDSLDKLLARPVAPEQPTGKSIDLEK